MRKVLALLATIVVGVFISMFWQANRGVSMEREIATAIDYDHPETILTVLDVNLDFIEMGKNTEDVFMTNLVLAMARKMPTAEVIKRVDRAHRLAKAGKYSSTEARQAAKRGPEEIDNHFNFLREFVTDMKH